MTIETICREEIEDWSRSRRRLVLVNREVTPSFTANDLSPEMVERLDGARLDFLVASRDELDRIGIVLVHDQLARFRNGEPVLIVAGRVDHRDHLKRGRRQKEELERQVQDALAVQSYVGIERLCAWMRLRDGRRVNVTVPELRERAIAMLAAEAWLDDPKASEQANEDAPPTSDRFHWPPLHVEGNLYRFTFGPDLVAAMLAASETAPRRYGDLYGDDAQGVLRFEILFRGADGDIVSSNDILEIDSGVCETNCQPHLSLAGFAEAYDGSVADANK